MTCFRGFFMNGQSVSRFRPIVSVSETLMNVNVHRLKVPFGHPAYIELKETHHGLEHSHG